MMRSAFDIVSACASVLATTKSQPTRPAVIMLLTALPPAPPQPNTVIRGLSPRMSGDVRLMVIGASLQLRGAKAGGCDRSPAVAVGVVSVAVGVVETWCADHQKL